MPMMAFIGVRISWLMLARKSDLACVAVLGRPPWRPTELASSRLKSVMSWVTPYMSVALPFSSFTTWPRAWIQTTRPSTGRL